MRVTRLMRESYSFVYESIFQRRLTGQMVLGGGILMRYLFMSDVTNPRARGWGILAPLKIYCRAVRTHGGALP